MVDLPDIPEYTFCAGSEKFDSCQGDSGGPAVYDKKLVGIVSSGPKICASEIPGVYVKVADYYKWILNTTGIIYKSKKENK